MELLQKKDLIYDKLRNDISSGKLRNGEKLPHGVGLAKQLGVSHGTLRSALVKLEENGYITVIHGKGTFVRNADTHNKKFLVIAEIRGGLSLPCHYILPGIERVANTMNIGIETCDFEFFNMQKHEEVSERLKTRNISGIILVANNIIGNEKIINLLSGNNVPVLLPIATRKDYQVTGWATLAFPERPAWRDALKHLREMGHRRIASLVPNCSKIRGYSNDEYRDLLGQIGADTNEDLIVCCPFESAAIRKAVRKVIDLPMPPTAIMCNSDFWAPDVYHVIKEAGLRIPGDMAVMGFASGFNCDYINPTLSTIDVDFFELGGKAVETLAKADTWFKPKVSSCCNPFLTIEYRLKIRESTNNRRFEEKISTRAFALQPAF